MFPLILERKLREMSYLERLNSAQYEAVTAPLGAVRVLAGAGSGKTRVLIARIAWLLETEQAAPHQILAVTFTNKAALEMKVRLETLVDIPLRGIWLGTFHSLCHRFLRLHHVAAGLSRNFQIMDSDDQIRLCRQIIRDQKLDDKLYPPRELANFINEQKDEGRRAEHLEMIGDPKRHEFIRLYQIYQAQCEAAHLVDFSELLLRTLEVLRTNQLLLSHFQERFRFILVDEFQDTNAVQYAWLQLLASRHQQIFVVGDDDQSIYGWRGARVENILYFDEVFPQSVTIHLEQNYRSTEPILKAANAVISKNSDRLVKELWTEEEGGEPISLYHAQDGYDEARFVADTIEEIHQSEKVPLNQFAILYRSNAQSRLFEELFLRRNLPYRIYGGLRFFDRAEIKDLLAHLRLLVNRNDDISLERIFSTPPKGIGAVTIDKIRAERERIGGSLWGAIQSLIEQQALSGRAHNALVELKTLIESLSEAAESLSLPDLFKEVIVKSRLIPHYKKEPMGRGEDRLENLNELVSAAQDFILDETRELLFSDESSESLPERDTLRDLEEFLVGITLDATEAQREESDEAIQLMTLHASKGLEFSYVFIVGMEEGLFPNQRSMFHGMGIEEERRLAYVGITRAKRVLFLSYAMTRMLYGQLSEPAPSRFIGDIPSNLLKMVGSSITVQAPNRALRRSTALQEMGESTSGFKINQRVTHPKFGDGLIVNFEGSGAATRVTVNFSAHGVKTLVLNYARLTPL